ncbi:MAG: hypothetical protein L0219_10480, partial [Phycisphaerales bacterium]|nr:hypothetical protein [Phycisphaerales bacterium]
AEFDGTGILPAQTLNGLEARSTFRLHQYPRGGVVVLAGVAERGGFSGWKALEGPLLAANGAQLGLNCAPMCSALVIFRFT